MLNSHTVSLPTPHGLVFSPRGLFAVGTDPGSGYMTLLQPSSEGIAVLARCQTPYGFTPSPPVWTTDGRYVIVANAGSASLSIYEMGPASGDRSNSRVHLLGTTRTDTPVTTLLAHPGEPAVFTSRAQRSGSRLELWKVHRSRLRLASNTWISGHVAALAQHAGDLWIATQDRLIRIPIEYLCSPYPFEVPLPMHGAHAIATQDITRTISTTCSRSRAGEGTLNSVLIATPDDSRRVLIANVGRLREKVRAYVRRVPLYQPLL
jgi:hypothetical protein